MGFVKKLFGIGADPREAMIPLYGSIVAEARAPWWYAEAGVPDTLDGRFDMVAAILSLVLLRLEGDPDGPAPSALLAERFVRDVHRAMVVVESDPEKLLSRFASYEPPRVVKWVNAGTI